MYNRGDGWKSYYKRVYKFGKEKEAQLLPFLTKSFGRDIKPYESQYSKHDFYCDEYDYELKSRNNKMEAFPDTMIGSNKVIGGKKPIILIFHFTDKTAYIKYDEELFKTFRIEMFAIEGNQPQKYYFIPISKLTILV